ncbi:gliding motility-associated C-terminal domain-containing protein [Flavobacteriaceae bacterium AU392]|nr:gliding motility-associated C-terminal domain-containing protein [Flavobacteriaceae bacterium]RKM85781.1 gliding motility-associated C-terminal domain-containing protein [Flavobacteriaceae bacterium AU392]
MKYIKGLILILFLFFTKLGYSQFSRTHYIPPLTASNSTGSIPQGQYLYISTPTATNVNVRIIPLGGTPIDMVVSNGSPIEFFISNTNDSQLVVNSSDTASLHNDKGYIIEAEDLVYVTVRLLAGNNFPQAGGLVSKGLAGLGRTFRVGTFTSQTTNPAADYLSFVSVLATEDNTDVSFTDLGPGVVILNNTPTNITLNTGESYIIALQTNITNANGDGLIGTLVSATKPIAVNSGSFNGSNDIGGGRDIGIDQLVPLERIGNEYVFVRARGNDQVERPLIVAHENDTEVFINGTTLLTTLDAGEFISIDGSNYGTNNNLYVTTSKNVFAYQGIGGVFNSEPNQGMFFVPPINCQTPRIVDNIPFINNIGSITFSGGITIVTEVGASVTINGTDILALGGVRQNITGNPNLETYIVEGLSGNVSVVSTRQVYVAYFGANGAAAFGGYYSGFSFTPEVSLQDIDVSQAGQCIPNVQLGLSSISSFDTFQWFLNDQAIPGATDITFIPQEPGFYYVVGEISGCPGSLQSDVIPVSACPTDIDNDDVNDNIDIDNDNDGILNCSESFGNQDIDLSNSNGGTIPIGNYTYTGIVMTQGNVATTPFIGAPDGSFRTDLPAQTGNDETSVTYQLDFDSELSLQLEYASTTTLGNGLLTNDEEFILRVPNDKNITVLNPDNQILIDTNFDGIFETGVTEFSSFEIRFRVNGPSLALGAGTFSFSAHLVDSFIYTHKTNSETSSNQATFRIITTCVPRDIDNDGIEDALDLDSDNDTVPDIIESQGVGGIIVSNVDVDANGLDDVFDINAIEIDTDIDTVPDYIDLDSDNDGIYDIEESGSLLSDTDFDGIVDNPIIDFGLNGWIDAAETNPDSGEIGYVLVNTDADILFNYRDSDSDADLCSDVIEAGFSDGNGDAMLGDTPVIVNILGVVTNANDGYITPNPNYIIAAPISIDVQPTNQAVCELSDIIINLESSEFDTIQWQVSNDGILWTNLTDDANYNGVTTANLSIITTPLSFNTTQYRARLDRIGNSCGLFSDEITLTVYPLPIINTPVELLQCDNDIDGFSAFNLNEVNLEISSNAANETFTYFLTEAEARSGDTSSNGFIANPTTYINRTPSSDIVWARITSEFGCAVVSEVQLRVSVTAIPASFQNIFTVCDDFLDSNGNDTANNDNRDGIATFDFSNVTPLVEALFPVGQNPIISYYRNEADALEEINAITDPSNYRNIGYPNSQDIYIRVDSEINNDCLGFGVHVTLNVEALPIANTVTIERQCDDDDDGIFPFDVSQVETDLLNGQDPNDVTITYFDENNNPLPSPLPNPFLTTSQTIRIVLTNNITNALNGPCTDETTLEFIVDDSPIANTVIIDPVCDDGIDDADGLHDFDTSQIQSTILNGQTGMEVFYFDGSGNTLPSPLPNPFTSATQTISVEVVNPINRNCVATTSFDLIVNPLPDFSVETPIILCQSDPNFSIVLDPQEDNPTQNFTYFWTNSTGDFLSDESTLTVTIPGTYFVTLTTTDGTDCSRTREIFVNASELATITLDDIDIVDISDNNTITINTTNNNLGLGDYEFSLDSEFGPYQDEPFFENVAPGFHTIYVRDKNGCGTVSIEVSVIGFPRFFTPNNDGDNDFWQVRGVNEQFQPDTIIYIFDRYGKLIKQLSPLSIGWDGTFNGESLPTNDYWFRVRLQDGREVTRHFTLKR